MYVVVVYDADPHEREIIRAVLMPKLHWIQNSVFAGELNQVAAKDLLNSLTSYIRDSKVTFWLFDKKPETVHIGKQDDGESIFM